MDYKFCTECGTKVEKNSFVCTTCGKQFANVQDAYDQRQEGMAMGGISSSSFQELKKRPLIDTRSTKQTSQTKKASLIIGGILVVLLLGGYFLGSTLTSKEKVIQKFEEALKERDATALAGIVDSTDPNLTITEKNLYPFLSYIEDHPENASFSTLEKAGFANILPSGKKWFFFDNYKVYLKSFYPVISTNFDGTEIYVNKKMGGRVNHNEGKMFGPYLVGEYQLKAVYKGKYATLNKEEVIEPQSNTSNKIEVNFTLPENYLSIYSDQDDAYLYVNGKNTNQRISEIDRFGPVVFDGSITIHAETKINGNVIKSNETTLVDEDFRDVGLIFNYQDDKKDVVVIRSEDSPASDVSPDKEDLSSLNVEAEVKEIRSEYNKINKMQKNYNLNKYGDNYFEYINDYGIIKKIVKKDNGLTTEYYFWDDGSLFFILTTTGRPLENRYYFKNNQMIRWIDSNKRTININTSKVNQAYKDWENYWVNQILSSMD
ncbi:zinc ribbon domain-containing protein [Neobacillus drentensis]|uniref:zinc ribbon domain-containing protein n=1 Tax=Neobacillus drentensis TaxID=220684 RepID=UPI002FFF6385